MEYFDCEVGTDGGGDRGGADGVLSALVQLPFYGAQSRSREFCELRATVRLAGDGTYTAEYALEKAPLLGAR